MNPTFSKSAVGIFIATAAALFALSLILSAGEDNVSRGEAAGPGVNSTSAVGYAGLYDVLRRAGLPVRRSSGGPLRESGDRGTLIVAEPMRQLVLDADSGSYSLEDAKRLLLVLPKWKWTEDSGNPSWVSAMSEAGISEAQMTLALVAIDESLVFRKNAPERWTTNEFQFSPEISGVAQLLHPSAKMKTLAGDGDGALLAEITEEGRTVWILTDPDVMSNHGFMKGDNAAFMISVISSLSKIGNENSGGRTPIVFDETIHGFVSENDSILRMIMRFPYAIVTILGVIWVIMLISAGAGRFGVPETPKRAVDFGKAQLIDNGARMLDYGGHHAVTLGRYARMAISETARALRLLEESDAARTAEWVDRIGKSRNVSVSCSLLLERLARAENAARPDISKMMDIARLTHKWKGEILNESGIHRKRH
ncbi:MAG: hypothetical protein LBS45_00030 [Synergistaceae bacterium]|jgi:hypothetical protein|nr:hypothetical protein [Synergistaceae bacterium]